MIGVPEKPKRVRFKRECSKCGKLFMPIGKFTKVCDDCSLKRKKKKADTVLKIRCDDRENGIVVAELIKMGLDCDVCRLKECDYIYEDICVERKTIDDFCESIKNGRLKNQAKAMDKFTHKYVLISGRIGDRKSDISENCVLGMISSLVVGGVNVICVDNDKQLAFLMKRLFKRYKDKSMV